MPCSNENHTHDWPSSGKLFICRCEVICGYCSPDSGAFSSSGGLRTHVKELHIGGTHPDKTGVRLEKGYTGRVKDNKCPCEVREEREEGLLKNKKASNSVGGIAKKTKPSISVVIPVKRARSDSEDASLAKLPLRHLRMQLDTSVEWALEAGLTGEVAIMLGDALKKCSNGSQTQQTPLTKDED